MTMQQPPPGEITRVLAQLKSGDKAAADELLPLVYPHLRRLASYYMRGERKDHTLQATGLVHEAFIRLLKQENLAWEDRNHFFGVAAGLMRRILVDYARAHRAGKRGGPEHDLPLDEALVFAAERSSELIALDDALKQLAEWDHRQSQIVELRFFVGLSEDEIAEVLGISVRTVKRDWAAARAWLHTELGADSSLQALP
jgi:RNA polymerase sigma-70 factor (ECF subfamily)